mgnify:CR=1 FL=1
MIIFLFIIGLCFGSFLNVLIWRLNNKNVPKFWQGRSICPKCRHILSWADNIPLLSFIFLRGKCRYCKKPISWQYPVVEIITAVLFLLIGFHPVIWAIGSVFIVIFFSDLIYGFIPDEMIIVGVILSIPGNLLVAAGTALPFFIFAKLKMMGEGDIGLAFLMGLLLGWPKVGVALWSGFIVGGLTAIILILLKKTKISATIPLGPFLILGIIIAVLWSDKIFKIIGFG